MDCEKYAECMIDCALGQLPPALQLELTSHVANCAACRQAHERAQRAADLIDRGLDLLVAGEPSPRFAARLYARIADEQPIRNSWARRFPIAASVLLSVGLAAVIAMTYLKGGTYQGPEPKVASLSSRGGSNVRATARPLATIRRPHAKESRSYARTSIAAQPEVLVLPYQMAALDQFDEALRRYQAAGARIIAQQGDAEQPMKIEQMKITPLEVKSIEVPAIPDFTDSWGGF